MFFLGKIDDITTYFLSRSIQDLLMLIISPVSFSVFILSCLFISLELICSKTTGKSINWGKLIQPGTPGQHTKNRNCPVKIRTVGMSGIISAKCYLQKCFAIKWPLMSN